jgi:simple sugar transport system substrate-binding protein
MMVSRRRMALVGAFAVIALVGAACSNKSSTTGTSTSGQPAKQFVFGMLLVGPKDDHGWSQANYEAGQYVVQKLGGPTKAKLIVLDKVNSADRPSVKAEDVVSDMIRQGAQLIFATSDDFKDAIFAAAKAHPDVPMIWSSGDSAWAQGKDYQPQLQNLGNYYMKMEYGQEIAGCAAGLTTQSGKLGVVGPLINDETRRFVNAAYLGARYCWQNYRHQDPSKLSFTVKWIGFWFNIPGTTLDPTQVTNDLFNSGADVVFSHLDTTEALVRAGQLAQAGKKVWAVPYDYKGACTESPQVCLGVPYFNWGPGYLRIAKSVIDGTFKPQFIWDGPDWSNINNPDTSAVGFQNGPALSSANATTLAQFIKGLGDGSIQLFQGPLAFQNGTQFLAPGQKAQDQEIWYESQLLKGIAGASTS